MSNEKRFITFAVLAISSMLLMQFVMEKAGLLPPPAKPKHGAAVQAKPGAEPEKAAPGKGKTDPQKAAVARADEGRPKPDEPKVEAKAAAGAKAGERAPRIAVAPPSDLVLGSDRDKAPGGYRLEVHLAQQGAGVESVASSRFEAEFEEGKPRHRPLQLIRRDPTAPASLSLTLADADDDEPKPEALAEGITAKGEAPLEAVLWEVVRDGSGRAARPIPEGAATEAEVKGREVVFRAKVDRPAVVVTKTYRLMKGEDAFSLTLDFESPDRDSAVVYRLLGPHGIPIEGEWYTSTFRDIFFGQLDRGQVSIVTRTAYDVVKAKAEPERFQALPLRYAGVENQYFADFLAPYPSPKTADDRWDAEAVPRIIHEGPSGGTKADVAVEITSKPVKVGPNRAVRHTYRVFTGPKTTDALAPYGAEDLASYRKNQWFSIPFASTLARHVISPLLDRIYEFTRQVARVFGGTRGNYGIAIILLTLLVRMMMFPLSRKQALAMKKMQDLQPLLKEIQEKYKDDKERQGRETFALYRKHGVNPAGGCLPAVVQLPIFVGLWQTLNNSVHLRHATFLWINDLAAPDMLFRFPVELPYVGHYFNLLPFLVVALMLVQTRLFTPPPTTEEARMQQSMMKYMMIFMAFMFYRVASGLGVYFITSSTWQICERLLLPKITPQSPPPELDKAGSARGAGGNGAAGGRGAAPEKPKGRLAQLFERLLDEASKDPTYRKMLEQRDSGKPKDDDKGKPRARPGKRR